MRIVNPIYDVAFKYLMEDTEIARGLLSSIIGENIQQLILRPQELTTKSESFGILIFRLDFKATIKLDSGEFKTILIELQKAKVYDDLMRFRRYLGENYKKKDQIIDSSGKTEEKVLPITTIYFLGFSLPNVNTSLLKVNREYVDLVSGKTLKVKTEFVEKLTHDSYVILIPELPSKKRTELEGILKVFNQKYQLDYDPKLLEINEEEFVKNELSSKIINRLRNGATNEEVLNKMLIEEEVETTIEKHIREKEELKEKMEIELQSKNQELQSKDQELQSKDQELQSKKQLLKEQQRIIAELRDKLKGDS